MSHPRTTDDRRDLLKAAVVRIEELESELLAAEQRRREPIAIVGLGCRFPAGANDPEAFWNLLRSGTDAIVEVPADRWNVEEYFDANPDAPGKTYSRWGGFLDQVDRFDADFFGIAPREASTMDPQQRLLLEVCWEALEHAGICASGLKGSSTGVFLGLTATDFGHMIARGGPAAISDAYVGSGGAPSVAAGRLAYTLGLQGPCITVDTACSSSLVAVHLACQSLRSGECCMALASGVSLILAPNGHIMAAKGRMLSPDGRCYTFDSRANGYVRSEGCGVVVLKRLSDAQADGDRVLAVIRSSAINQDGRSSGLTAPNGRAQEEVMRRAIDGAGIQPEDISYVETHGTGTTLGDPIEVGALGAVHKGRASGSPILIGSVKSNIGHLEAAAGIAAFIKVVLALQKGQLPPHLHFREPNPHIPWSTLPVQVTGQLRPWPSNPAGRLAGISSFGFSGTNAHVIVEGAATDGAACSGETAAGEPVVRILPVSAKSEAALRVAAAAFAEVLGSESAPSFADMCFTAASGRSHHEMRLAAVVSNGAEAAAALKAFAAGEDTPRVFTGPAVRRPAQPVFVFGGQGSQYVGMGRELFEHEPAFRSAMLRCDAILTPLLPFPLLDVIYPAPRRAAESERMLGLTEFTQPALFAIEFALSELWRSWGVEPAAVIGHSIGEYTAACVAGVFRLEDALELVAERGRLMQSLPEGGAMLAVLAEHSRVAAFVEDAGGSISVAAVNGPQNVVIAGRAADIAAAAGRLEAAGIATRALDVSHAFHSSLLDPVLDDFERLASRIEASVPRLELISNLTGKPYDEGTPVHGSYWRQHARQTVRFADGIKALRDVGHSVFLEISPSASLVRIGQSSRPSDSNELWIASLRRDSGNWLLMESVAALHSRGVKIDWGAYYQGRRAGSKVSLPTYPFQRQRFWFVPEPAAAATVGEPARNGHPLLGARLRSPRLSGIVYQATLDPERLTFLNDHRIAGRTILPASAYLEIATAAAADQWEAGEHEVRDLAIREPMQFDGGSRLVQTILETSGGEMSLEICSSASVETDGKDSPWTTHATAVLSRLTQPKLTEERIVDDGATATGEEHDPAAYYEMLESAGAVYGPAFRLLAHIRSASGMAYGEIAAGSGQGAPYHLHPAVLDASFQLAGIALTTLSDTDGSLYMPIQVGSYRLFRRPVDSIKGRVAIREPAVQGLIVCDVSLSDSAGSLARIEGVTFRKIGARAKEFGTNDGLRDVFSLSWKALEGDGADSTTSVDAGVWLVFDDGADWAAEFARHLTKRTQVVHVQRGDAYDAPRNGTAVVRSHEPEDFIRLVRDAATGSKVVGAVYFWSFYPNQSSAPPAPGCGSVELLHVVQALLGSSAGSAPRLTIVTRGAQAAVAADPHVDMHQAAAWGFARTLATEEPSLRSSVVDLDPDDSIGGQLEQLARHVRSVAPSEGQLAFRSGRIYVPRLSTVVGVVGENALLPVPSEGGYSLEIAERGVLDHLRLQAFDPGPPLKGEVRIEVAASGMNFRDVMNALGMYPGNPGPLGNECAGRISAIGEGVEGLAPGDLVMALTPRGFCSSVNTSASLVCRIPAGMSVADAAAFPLAFQTAYYALVHVARLKRGERILIHAGAGGVGLAAIQIAQSTGAEIFATAGSAAKRNFLSSLGVPHVMSSRTLDFADTIRDITGGGGVDAVLNSLAGEFIPRSLGVLAEGGCFLELGKTGILSRSEAVRNHPGIRYEAIFLGEVCNNEPSKIQEIYRDLMRGFESGVFRPLPKLQFPINLAKQAFRFMAQARHTGKIVLSSREHLSDQRELNANATYLITGGMGALGLHTARWMAKRGARRIVLLGRSAPSPEAVEAIGQLTVGGVEVVVARADVADREAVAAVLENCITTEAPLRGVVHAAGETDAILLRRQDGARFAKVFAAKVAGAMHLDRLTREADLDFFVLYSAGAAILGAPGLASYAAANASLDALAAERRACGLPAVSINWGPWIGAGMAAKVTAAERKGWEAQGIRMIDPEFGFAALESILAGGAVQAAVLPLDWAVMTDPPAILQDVAPTRRAGCKADSLDKAQQGSKDFAIRLESALPEDRPELLRALVREHAARVLGLAGIYKRDDDRGFTDLGLDSLMAVELRNRLTAAIGRKLPATIAFDHATIGALADHLGSLLDERRPAVAVTPGPKSPVQDAWELDALSEEALERQLAEELERAGY